MGSLVVWKFCSRKNNRKKKMITSKGEDADPAGRVGLGKVVVENARASVLVDPVLKCVDLCLGFSIPKRQAVPGPSMPSIYKLIILACRDSGCYVAGQSY